MTGGRRTRDRGRLLLFPGFLLACTCLASPGIRAGGLTDTLPRNAFLLDVSYHFAWLDGAWDGKGRYGSLLPDIDRYEPGGSLQGTLTPDAKVRYHLTIFQLQVGLADALSLGIGIPLVIRTDITPDLRWTPGDFQPFLGRAYTEEDFWQWAASMGQPKPGPWTGNRNVLGDVVLGLRFRFTDFLPKVRAVGIQGAVTVQGALPTGRQADPEEVVAAGTTMWDLQAQGDLGIHLALEKTFGGALQGRLTLGLDLFYEAFLPHRYASAFGRKNPLLLNYGPYAGKAYWIDGGDLAGAALQVEGVIWKGPARASFVSGGSLDRARMLPPLWTASVRLASAFIGQTGFTSQSSVWDAMQEEKWRPGYRNVLVLSTVLSLLRLGAPLQVTAAWRSTSLIPGKNTRASDSLSVGIRIPGVFW
ncbi:hypothetical protein KBD49_03555 [Myxococcota bacterium]|nr:hypothetical protein [Myxococcota bacterium]